MTSAMAMGPRDFLRELVYPAGSPTTLITLATFLALILLAASAGMLGIWLAIVVVPAYLRYLTMIASARARDREASPPGIEFFTPAGNAWTLFPVIPVVLLAQQYLVRLLDNGDQVGAVKLMLRCRDIDVRFRPLAADMPRAMAAARDCNNPELADSLSRRC